MFRVGQGVWDRCLLGVSLLALSGCTAILDFSEPIGKRDGGPAEDAGDAAAADDASPAICTTFEPNDSIAEAVSITPMDVASAVCSLTDQDVYAFSVGDGQDVTITLAFTAAAGDDLDLQLLSALGTVIEESIGTSDTEQITRSGVNALTAGTYHIVVKPVAVSSAVPYSINLAITAAP